jgi:citrate lyase subunit alpha / citrate CoA-transferase
VLVTERGVAVNPRRTELAEQLRAHGVEVVPIEALREISARGAAPQANRREHERIVAVVEYRDGCVIDVVRQVAE